MNVLCVYPAFPRTYWGAEYTMPLTGKKALLPRLARARTEAAAEKRRAPRGMTLPECVA